MANPTGNEVLDFLLAISKEHPVATSLAPMGLGFLLLVAEQARKEVRPAAVKLIYTYLGICSLLVIAAFAYTIIQPTFDLERAEAKTKHELDRANELQTQLEHVNSQLSEARSQSMDASVKLSSLKTQLEEAQNEAQRERLRAEKLEKRLSDRDAPDQMALTSSLARIHSFAVNLEDALSIYLSTLADINGGASSSLRNMFQMAVTICGLARDQIVTMAGGTEETRVQYVCVRSTRGETVRSTMADDLPTSAGPASFVRGPSTNVVPNQRTNVPSMTRP